VMRHGGQFVAVVVLIASCSARSAVPVGSETGEDSGTSESGDIDDTWEADLPVGVDLPY